MNDVSDSIPAPAASAAARAAVKSRRQQRQVEHRMCLEVLDDHEAGQQQEPGAEQAERRRAGPAGSALRQPGQQRRRPEPE
ncbi:hypothetical protein ACQEVZ_06815 [Dactylosporangium sp. CA-152071]|uniref:hypothetical protein n=1 Tax=Dactylosporangium sp. CA-152071 TaxID=3239933 RepID=UPI003D8D0E23